MTATERPRKVLIIGSGPIVIGQAAEFDYAGTQACKAMREEDIASVLVNSNPATIMTDDGVADTVYIEPLTIPVLERVIARERPDGLLPTLGGQTGLNLAVDLAEAGILDRYGVRMLGTPLATIRLAEDREQFRDLLQGIGEPTPESAIVESWDEAVAARDRLGLPLVIRPAYTLGGTGGGLAHSEEEYEQTVRAGLAVSPISQVLVERSLLGWKEIEYEVMRDGADTCVMVCNMENMDPMGVHTGDSIVVAPSQTLSDKDHQMLRSSALKIIRALGVEGGCNVQFALAPRPDIVPWEGAESSDQLAYHVIEVNPRVSRSSALASKATGYPIARVAAKIAVGRRLDEITNSVTERTTAAFEPALDYCVVKIPRWPFDKFAFGDRSLGTQMKATGEVMAIDRVFEAALQKAIRSLEVGDHSVLWEDPAWRESDHRPLEASDLRLWSLLAELRRDVAPLELSKRTGIDPWFTERLARIVALERRLLAEELTPGATAAGKAAGLRRRTDRRARRQPAGARPRPARRVGHPPRVQDGRYLRGGVRRRDPVFLQHLRNGERGAAERAREYAGDRLGADPHRPGDRVRLLLGAGGAGPARRGACRRSSPTPTPRPSPPTSTPPTACTSSHSTRSRCATCSRTRPARMVRRHLRWCSSAGRRR